MISEQEKKELIEIGTTAFYTSIKSKTNEAVENYTKRLQSDLVKRLQEKLQDDLVETPLLESLDRFEQYYAKRVGESAKTKTKMGLLSRLVNKFFGEKLLDTTDKKAFVSALAPQSNGLKVKRDFIGEIEQAITKNILAKMNKDPEFSMLTPYSLTPKQIAQIEKEKLRMKLLEIPKAKSPNLKRELADEVVMDVFKAIAAQRIAEARTQKELMALKSAMTQFIREYHYSKLASRDIDAINRFIETEEQRKYRKMLESSPEARKLKKDYEQILALICLRNEELLKKEYRGLKKLRYMLSSVCKKLGIGHKDVAKEMEKLKQEIQKERSKIKTMPIYLQDLNRSPSRPAPMQAPRVIVKKAKKEPPLFNSPSIYDRPNTSERETVSFLDR
jgi:dGTP triphosphohydrolase